MKTITVDNFFDNPDTIRNYGLSLEYRRRTSAEWWEGRRTQPLSSINRGLHEHICSKVLKEYYGSVYDYEANSFFHITTEDDKKDPNWMDLKIRAHQDHIPLAAIIYLSPDAPLECGTQTYKNLVPDVVMSNVYNRMIAYDGDMWHSAMDYFDTRLVALIFFSRVDRD